MMLETERLVLRRWEESDLKSDRRAIGAIELKLNGHTDMTEKEDECELGYWLGKPFWGQGLIPEAAREMLRHAFENLGMSKVWCGYYDGNNKSKRVQEKLGFQYQWTTEDVDVPLMHENRTGHVNCMNKSDWERLQSGFQYITLRERPELKLAAAQWFHSKWGVPAEAYLECMEAYIKRETEYGWYLCLTGSRIVGGLGVIDNDFHDRKDLTPNVCAVYTEEDCRGKGIAGHLLRMVVEDLRSKGIMPVYLLTDHMNFYERYGWEFLCMVQGDGELEMSRMYIHR